MTTPEALPERLYTLAEVAQQTGFALRTLQREARANKIPHIHRGRVRLMTAAHIHELIRASTVTVTAPIADKNAGVEKIRALLARQARG